MEKRKQDKWDSLETVKTFDIETDRALSILSIKNCQCQYPKILMLLITSKSLFYEFCLQKMEIRKYLVTSCLRGQLARNYLNIFKMKNSPPDPGGTRTRNNKLLGALPIPQSIWGDVISTYNSHHESMLQQSRQQLDYINSTATTPISLLVQSLVKQLCSLLEKDQNKANQLYNTICEKLYSMKLIDSSYSMGEFEVMRSQYQRALTQFVAVTNGSDIPVPATWPILPQTGLEWSRYHREFKELYYIAKGGFGHVFKAKHRLDGVEYAVKKIYIKSSDVDSIMNHLSEVKTIASLDHPNIVNYKAAWLEPLIESALTKDSNKLKMETDSDCELSSSKVELLSSALPNTISSFKTHNSKELTRKVSFSDFIISFKNSSSFENNDDPDEIFENTESDENNSSQSIHQKENAICKLFSSNDYERCSRINLEWATLFIQMTYCEQTLEQWLDKRNRHVALCRKNSEDFSFHAEKLDSPSNSTCPVSWTHMDKLINMFTQLVRGLEYIHSRGVIHHDIKPSNIFIVDNEPRVLLGDFGLACPLQRSHNGTGLGTKLYAAPEQLEGQCDSKSDMYSLGIILLELIEPFTTSMERVTTITALRKGQIPANLTANYPKIAHIIGKLIQRRPSHRLDTTQLLEELKTLLENKDDTIKSLREELAAKDEEIAHLRMMLAKNKINS